MLNTRAIVSRDAYETGGWELEEVTVREPGEGELLVQIYASGLCHSDLTSGGAPKHLRPEHYPQVFGHEGAGYVKAKGPGVSKAEIGDPVLCSFATCGSCYFCKQSTTAHCVNFAMENVAHYSKIFGTVGDKPTAPNISGQYFGHSAFAKLTVVKESSIVNAKNLINSKMELTLFGPLGCGFQTGSGSITNVAKAGPEDIVCIVGLGGVGLAAVMAANIQGCRQIIGVDLVESRLQLGKELGCTHVVNSSSLAANTSLVDHIKALAEGVGPTITIDMTGVPSVIEAGITFTRRGGKYLQVGLSKDPSYEIKFNLVRAIIQGVWFIGALEGHATPQEYIPQMISWYRAGLFPIDKLVKCFSFDDWEQAVKGMLDGTVIKPVLVWDD